MINTRFNVIKQISDSDCDLILVRYLLPQVPIVGELINILGNPYSVFERGWSINEETGDLHCYIRLIPFNNNKKIEENEE